MDIIEIIRIIIVPILISVVTLIVGSKIKETESKREKNEKENKQINGFYIKLKKLKMLIKEYENTENIVTSLKEEVKKIENGEIDVSKAYDKQFNKDDFLHQLELKILDYKRFSLPEKAEPIINTYSELKKCPIDDLNGKKHLVCKEFIEMDYSLYQLLDKKEVIDELLSFIKPEYK